MIKSDRIQRLILITLDEQGPTDWGGLVNAINDNNLQPTHPHGWPDVVEIVRGLIKHGEVRHIVSSRGESFVRVSK